MSDIIHCDGIDHYFRIRRVNIDKHSKLIPFESCNCNDGTKFRNQIKHIINTHGDKQ